ADGAALVASFEAGGDALAVAIAAAVASPRAAAFASTASPRALTRPTRIPVTRSSAPVTIHGASCAIVVRGGVFVSATGERLEAAIGIAGGRDVRAKAAAGVAIDGSGTVGRVSLTGLATFTSEIGAS